MGLSADAGGDLLDIRLVYRTASGQLLLDTTFDELSEELADPNYLADVITIDMHNELKRVHQMIHDEL